MKKGRTDNEKEMYKGFFKGVKEKIKRQDVSVEDKLIVILLDMENMLRYMEGGTDNDVYDFIETVCKSIKPNIVDPVKNCRCKESEELRKELTNVTSFKPHSFPCRSCTKVDEECIPTNFEGGGNGECPKYEDRVWANILKNKEMRSRFEINKKPTKDRHLTNKELAMWLSKGNGQFLNKRTRLISYNHAYYATDYEFEIDYLNIRVRKWEDDDWHEPTYNYCFGDK